jgi:glycosyltransferase involved in cell wall biosynthesis
MKLSVLMSVYRNESAEFLRCSLDSLTTQTVQADEIVVVKDGPLGDGLDGAIDSFRWRLPLATLRMDHQVGLGRALREGLVRCQTELVARMDSDDICLPDRFEKQLSFLALHPEIAVVGGAIAEFNCKPTEIETIRRMPSGGEQLGHVARFRNPLNHMTVIFRKASVLAAGNYEPYAGFEDYELWARMLMRGYRLHNLDDILVLVRCGNGMQRRRGGLGYLKKEIQFQRRLEQLGFVSRRQFLFNLITRAPVRMLPSRIRSQLYHTILRETPKTSLD